MSNDTFSAGMLDLRVRVVLRSIFVHGGSVFPDKVLNLSLVSVSSSTSEGIWTCSVSQLRPSCHQGVGIMLLYGTVGYSSGWLTSLGHQALNTSITPIRILLSVTRNGPHTSKCLEDRELWKNCWKPTKQVNWTYRTLLSSYTPTRGLLCSKHPGQREAGLPFCHSCHPWDYHIHPVGEKGMLDKAKGIIKHRERTFLYIFWCHLLLSFPFEEGQKHDMVRSQCSTFLVINTC